MAVYIHGFDWVVYANRIMPAFANWLVDGDERAIYQLFAQTRCAREEHFLPAPLHRLRIWPRAQAFVAGLARGRYSRREYARLCSAKQFTALNDRYLHKHAPHLYHDSDALRSVWGATIEEYCLPWRQTPGDEEFPEGTTGEGHMAGEMDMALARDATTSQMPSRNVVFPVGRTIGGAGAMSQEPTQEPEINPLRSELVILLQQAGLGELACEVGGQAPGVAYITPSLERFDWSIDEDSTEIDELTEDSNIALPFMELQGILIGQHPSTLHLRGWLASISVRAMVLFEYLACERRCMPFGYEPGEPFGCYIGYLTPREVWHLAASLHDVQAPRQAEAEGHLRFRRTYPGKEETFRLVDEVCPAYAADFLKAVRAAAGEGLGLICSVE